MAPISDGWTRGLTAPRSLPSLGTKLTFPLITAALVLLLGAAVFGLAS